LVNIDINAIKLGQAGKIFSNEKTQLTPFLFPPRFVPPRTLGRWRGGHSFSDSIKRYRCSLSVIAHLMLHPDPQLVHFCEVQKNERDRVRHLSARTKATKFGPSECAGEIAMLLMQQWIAKGQARFSHPSYSDPTSGNLSLVISER